MTQPLEFVCRAEELGPCTRCKTLHIRYGDEGQTLCTNCQQNTTQQHNTSKEQN